MSSFATPAASSASRTFSAVALASDIAISEDCANTETAKLKLTPSGTTFTVPVACTVTPWAELDPPCISS